MIFVAVGTQKFQFDRLIEAVDDLVKYSDEIVFGQIGNSNYIPQNYDYKRFLNKKEFNHSLEKAELVITHSGVATIMEAIKFGKPVIVVPRLEKYGEHVDDHQTQIAEAFEENNLILVCKDVARLAEKISIAREKKFQKYVSQKEIVLKTIEEYLERI